MPYMNEHALPPKVKALPEASRKLWMDTFNSTWRETSGDEGKAAAEAWNAVKQNHRQDDGRFGTTQATPVELSSADGSVPEWFCILPLGEVRLADSRPPFHVDEAGMARVVKAFKERGNDLVIDYEHKTIDGDEAPAAGWIKELQPRKDGLWARAEWNEKARAYIASKEYRYFSPVITLDKARNVLELLHAALTNFPAIANLTPLAAKWGLDEGDLEALADAGDPGAAQEARSAKWKIAVKKTGHVERPGEWASIPDEQFADPVNYRYPMPDLEQATTAWRYWSKPANRSDYDENEQAVITARIKARVKALGGKEPQSAADTKEANRMLIEALRKLLGLGAEATEADVITAASDLKKKADQVETLTTQTAALKTERDEAIGRATTAEALGNKVKVPLVVTQALGLQGDASTETVVGRIEGFKAGEAAGKASQTELAELKSKVAKDKADAMVKEALRTGRTSPEELSRNDGLLEGLALKDPAMFDTLVMSRKEFSVVPLDKLNLGDNGANAGTIVLTADEKATCASLGVSEAEYLKTKKAQMGVAA